MELHMRGKVLHKSTSAPAPGRLSRHEQRRTCMHARARAHTHAHGRTLMHEHARAQVMRERGAGSRLVGGDEGRGIGALVRAVTEDTAPRAASQRFSAARS